MKLPATAAGGDYVNYFNVIDQLEKEIDIAKAAIAISDVPETKLQALRFSTDAGYRLAQKTITGLLSSPTHFNSNKLLEDLNALVDAAINDAVFFAGVSDDIKKLNKKAYLALNRQVVQAINDVKKSVASDPLIRFIIPVTG